eukprot:12025310-Karenia_brevis.AAC.1
MVMNGGVKRVLLPGCVWTGTSFAHPSMPSFPCALTALWVQKEFDATLGYPGEGSLNQGTPLGGERHRVSSESRVLRSRRRTPASSRRQRRRQRPSHNPGEGTPSRQRLGETFALMR